MADRVTITTVARHAQVSVQTVSNVLNSPHMVRPATRQRVQDAIDALGYRANQAARQMRTGRSRLIAARIEPAQDGINGSILDRFLHGLADAAAPARYRVLLYTAADDNAEIATYEDMLSAYDIDAFVLTSTHHADTRTSWLTERGVPFVTFGRPWDAPGSHPWVDVDGAAGTAEATRHLLRAGHRRIGFIGWPAGSGVGDDRRSGWAAALAEAGVDPHGLDAVTPDGVAEGVAAARDLLSRDEPVTAMVCCSDSLALGALHATGGADPAAPGTPAPGRVAVIGFDDTPVAQAVGLTSIAQPLGEAATHCLRLLAAQLDAPGSRPPGDGQILLAPALVPRRTA
ncbi:LacI family DNA-binding transcriptional regulator [Catellatospora chokoriensis]|uniref:LacI family DNA-binding transcriptional regulator n=1 Tax=Catellatospora chokoriensis TaxID=310353 RepID=UPI001780F4D4|nr:substrate-binding domain-containing protein [Catellatospora chokoriensis]